MDLQREQLAVAAERLFGTINEAALAKLERLAQWVPVRRSEFLFHQGDRAEAVYVVASGRMHVVNERADGTWTVIGEAMPGETIGEMSFFTHEPRSAGVCAARDTMLIRFPNDAFDEIITAHPEIVRELMRVQVARARRSAAEIAAKSAVDVAIVALGDDVPLREFAQQLADATTALGSTLLLDPDDVDRQLGIEGISRVPEDDPKDSPLVAWLNVQESKFRFVIYQTDPGVSEWTERCIRQADRVILLANANSDASRQAVEGLLDDTARVGAPRRVLVLLHPDGDCVPSQTSRWLQERRIDEHHHVRRGNAADFARLARFLAGRAVGLVLGGGGARGFAHIGILRALRDANIPIDMVGGTSMGASMAAQFALGWTPEHILESNKHMWVTVRPHKRYTLPMVSFLSRKLADQCTQEMYGDVQIEDLWLRFFCVSSDLVSASAMVHQSGSLMMALTASAAVPGVTPPVWMDGRLLVDGAFLNNVPADVMRERGCGRVIAAEVTVEEDQNFTCERVPNPWELLGSKLPFSRAVLKFPSMIELLLRASLLASSRRQTDAIRTADLVFHPPINEFGLLEFEAIEKLERVGYEHAVSQIETWRASGSI